MTSAIATVENQEPIQLDKYRRENYNVLVPTANIKQISPFHQIRVEEVKIDPNPENGEVFKVGSKKVGDGFEDVLSLSKNALMKISNAAGIVWNWNETKPITATKDYVLYQAVGAFKKASGEWLPLKCTKEIDLTVIEEETYEANLKNAKKYANSRYEDDRKKLNGMTPEEWAAAQTKANMIQWRKNKLTRAETGAMLRVIRALLSIKHQYSPGELQKPFLVPHVDFSPDYSDPSVRKMVLEHGLQATAALFGNTAHSSHQQLQSGTQQAFSSDSFDGFDDVTSGEDDAVDYDGSIEGNYTEIIDDQDHEPENSAPTSAPTCEHEGCDKELSQKEADYSIQHYERLLCFRHQKLYKKVTS